MCLVLCDSVVPMPVRMCHLHFCCIVHHQTASERNAFANLIQSRPPMFICLRTCFERFPAPSIRLHTCMPPCTFSGGTSPQT